MLEANLQLIEEHYSVTRMQGFLSCPAKYSYQQEHQVETETSPPMLSGLAVHAGLEAKFKGGDKEAIVNAVLAVLGPHNKFAKGAVKAVGVCSKEVPAEVVQEVGLYLVLDVDGEPVRITGKPDLVELHPDGYMIVTEFKSTSKEVDKALHDYDWSQQGWLYATMIEEHYGLPVFLQFWVLSTQGNKEAYTEILPLTRAHKESAKEWAADVVRLLRTGARPMHASALCAWCPFKDVDWLRLNGGDWKGALEGMKEVKLEETENTDYGEIL